MAGTAYDCTYPPYVAQRHLQKVGGIQENSTLEIWKRARKFVTSPYKSYLPFAKSNVTLHEEQRGRSRRTTWPFVNSKHKRQAEKENWNLRKRKFKPTDNKKSLWQHEI